MGTDGDSERTPDYVLVGHVARDVFGSTSRPGGTVLYAGAAAARLGRKVGIVTSGDVPLTAEAGLVDAAVARVPSLGVTTFEISEESGGRSLRLIDRAAPLTGSEVPVTWRTADIIHLAPIADELPLDLAEAFTGRLVCTPQGWMRSFASDGAVRPRPERVLNLPLDRFAAIVLSEEDLGGDFDLENSVARRSRVLVVTRGASGCTLYEPERTVELPAVAAQPVDTTGAGDVFAGGFFVRLSESEDALESARFAAAAAALAVEGAGTSCIPDRDAVLARLALEGVCIE